MHRLSFRSTILVLLLLLSFLATEATAASKKYSVTGKVAGGAGYTVYLLFKDGSSKSAALSGSGKFSFKNLSASKLKGASLQLVNADGQYVGPVVLAKKGSNVSTTFKAKGKTEIDLGRIALLDSFAKVRAKLSADVYNRANVPADSTGKPVGAGESGLVNRITAQSVRALAETSPGSDSDADGIPDSFDADDDGDLVLDASDGDSEGQDVPFTSLVFDFRKTLNAHVRSGLSDSLIDEAISGENVFALTFFFSLPTGSPIDGGHVVCDDSLVYCRPNTPTAFYGGISESTSEFRNHFWSELLNTSGFPRMEQVTLSDGNSSIVASIQPRVGRSQFRPGDVYRVVLTEGTRESSSRTLALTPYFVSIPAIQSYDAGSGSTAVDYGSVTADSGSIPGASPGDPIVLSGAGDLNVTFWRPQRAAIRSDESGFYDWGNLHYGVIIEDAQATCAGFYSNVSSELEVDPSPLGEGDSPLANAGANMYPYTDIQGDRAANIANTLSFTVNLKDCLARVSRPAGTYRVNITAAGESLRGGSNAATQGIYVQIP